MRPIQHLRPLGRFGTWYIRLALHLHIRCEYPPLYLPLHKTLPLPKNVFCTLPLPVGYRYWWERTPYGPYRLTSNLVDLAGWIANRVEGYEYTCVAVWLTGFSGKWFKTCYYRPDKLDPDRNQNFPEAGYR